MYRLRLDLGYDGTDYAGWARQVGLRTVQGDLEAALATLYEPYGAAPRTVVAGRTDAGVHAVGQVVHTDLNESQRARHDAADIPRKINTVLGLTSGIVIRKAGWAPTGFDARFSALARRYEYRIADADESDDPLQRRRTARIFRALDVSAMNEAARGLVGLHDWASFCRHRDEATTIRTLTRFEWARDASGVAVATVEADAFCHSMVRALVGACVAVGLGRLDPGVLPVIRDVRARTNDFTVMPAKGLTLMAVSYPPESELAIRAEMTRNRRGELEEERTRARAFDDGDPTG